MLGQRVRVNLGLRVKGHVRNFLNFQSDVCIDCVVFRAWVTDRARYPAREIWRPTPVTQYLHGLVFKGQMRNYFFRGREFASQMEMTILKLPEEAVTCGLR